MADLSQIPEDELRRIAGASDVSNEELFKAAGIQPTESNVGLNTLKEKILPTFMTRATPAPGERTLLGNIFERPGAAIREGIRSVQSGEGFVEGFKHGSNFPEQSETFLQQSQREPVNTILQPTGNPITDRFAQAEQFYSGFTRDIGSLAKDFVTNPADILTDVLLGGAGRLIKSTKTPIQSASQLKNVDKSFSKAVRPSVSGKSTAAQVKAAKENARIAVDTIVGNKDKLQYADEAGGTVSGRLPQSLDELSQAVSQTKKQVFNAYTDMKRAAGEEMRVVFLDDVAQEIRKAVDNVATTDFAPQAKRAAIEIADRLDTRGFYSVEEANDVLENLNQQLKAFYMNPDPKLVRENGINALVANRLRDKLDTVINEEAVGAAGSAVQETFKTLKRRYGSLASIEKDVNRRLIVDSRKNNFGLLDFTDVFTGQQLAEGVIFQNPTALVRGATGKALKTIAKAGNNPNRIVKNMFKEVDRVKRGGTFIEKAGKQVLRRSPVLIQEEQARARQRASVH